MSATEGHNAFSTDASAVLQRPIDVAQDDAAALQQAGSLDVEAELECERVAQWVAERRYNSVALQFPDAMLQLAPRCCTALSGLLPECRVFVLGDTSYGSCCVDAVAAQHLQAQCVVHYGTSCLSHTDALPTLYVFPKLELDVGAVVRRLVKRVEKEDAGHWTLLYHVGYAHLAQRLQEALSGCEGDVRLSSVDDAHVPGEGRGGSEGGTRLFGRRVSSDWEEGNVVYLPSSDKDPLLLLLAMRLYPSERLFLSWNAESASFVDVREARATQLNRRFMKRFLQIEKAKDADTIGVVVSTLSIQHHMSVLRDIQRVIREADKKPYTLVVGKVNDAKLLNFPHVSVFCLLSCPVAALEISDAQNTSERGMTTSYRSIITPYELQIACQTGTEWEARWKTELADFVQSVAGEADAGGQPIDQDEEPRFSILQGSLVERKAVRDCAELPADLLRETAIVESRAGQIVQQISPAARYLNRDAQWSGLDPRADVEELGIKKAEQGRTGIAMQYDEGKGRDE